MIYLHISHFICLDFPSGFSLLFGMHTLFPTSGKYFQFFIRKMSFSHSCYFSNSFMRHNLFTYHNVHLFKMYKSVVFSIFIELYSHLFVIKKKTEIAQMSFNRLCGALSLDSCPPVLNTLYIFLFLQISSEQKCLCFLLVLCFYF